MTLTWVDIALISAGSATGVWTTIGLYLVVDSWWKERQRREWLRRRDDGKS
jgi:hypothetical protein